MTPWRSSAASARAGLGRGLGSGADSRGRSCRRGPAAMEAGAGQPQGGAGGGDHAWLGRQGGHGVHQDSSSLTIGRPRSKATFFWMSMTASAPVSYTHLRAHETDSYLVCRLLLE